MLRDSSYLLRSRAARDDAEACGTLPGAVGASLRTGLFVPAEDAQGAEGVPPARPALALVRLYRHPAGVPGLERPPAVAIALRRDQKRRFGHALVGRDAGAAQVVQPPQHVVVPPGREGEPGPRGAALAVPLDRLAGRPPSEEAALEEGLLPAAP